MRKFIITALALVFLLSAVGCGKKAAAPSLQPSSSAEATAAPTGNSEANTGKSDGTGIKRMTEETAPVSGEIDTDNDERDFTGLWRAVGTTSENASFEAMELEIHYSSYSVSMTFADSSLNTTIEGTYKIKNGVLDFDDNFKDCTAYFYDDDDDVLVLDNGTSLVYCMEQETEEDMR